MSVPMFGQPDPIAVAVRTAVASRLTPEDPNVKIAFGSVMKDEVMKRVEKLNDLIEREEARFERWSSAYLADATHKVDDAIYTSKLARKESTVKEWEDIRSAESASMSRM